MVRPFGQVQLPIWANANAQNGLTVKGKKLVAGRVPGRTVPPVLVVLPRQQSALGFAPLDDAPDLLARPPGKDLLIGLHGVVGPPLPVEKVPVISPVCPIPKQNGIQKDGLFHPIAGGHCAVSPQLCQRSHACRYLPSIKSITRASPLVAVQTPSTTKIRPRPVMAETPPPCQFVGLHFPGDVI